MALDALCLSGILVCIQLTSTISNTRYLQLLLSQTFSLIPSAFLVAALILCYLEVSQCRSIFSILQRFSGLFPIHYFERFHFSHFNVERINFETLIECLSFLISTEKYVPNTRKQCSILTFKMK